MLFKTPIELMQDIAQRTRTRRLSLNLSQSGLAAQSGVSLGSLKRFENTGQIALKSLLKIALVLDCLSEFENLIQPLPNPTSIKDLLAQTKHRKKGTRHAI